VSVNSFGQIDKLVKDVSNSISNNDGNKTENDPNIVAGLKEALNIGAGNAVDVVSVVDGYLGNELIKIMMPSELASFEPTLRSLGAGSLIDDFVKSMNRAAESAAKEATPIFTDALKDMTFEDALEILNGRENEATLYFQEKTTGKLTEKFKPVISNSINSVGVTKYYKDLTDKIKTIPMASAVSVDLDSYVTDKALNGLFTMVGEEEAKIRKDPAARVTDLLKDIFGGKP